MVPPLPLRVALLVLDLFSWIAPASRRTAWREQWLGELWHYDMWLAREQATPAVRLGRLLARASGAPVHAISLRLDDWSPRMLMHDLKFGWRMLVRRPAFTAVAVLILGLGIGANATIFSWIESVVLHPLPGVPAQDGIVVVRGVSGERTNLAMSYPNFSDLRAAKVDGLQDVMAFRVVAMNARTTGEPMRVFGELVTPNFLTLLGVRPSAGRDFRDDEGQVPGREPVVIVSHAFWMRALNADPAAVGRTMTINTQAFTIVGVTPTDFYGSVAGLALELFLPMTMQKTVISGDRLGDRGTSWMQVYGRLAPGATFERAQAGLSVAGARLAAAYPKENEGRGLLAGRLSQDGASGLLMPVMTMLMIVVGLVLLIACANLAGLLLARSAGRQREVAVRLAVGASRGRVVRQLLIENLMVAVAGGAAALLIARWTAGMLVLFVPPTPYPIGFHASLSLRVVAFSVALTVVTALVSGLLPALRGSRSDVAVALKDAAPANIGGGRARLRQGLVVAQVALSLLLLVGAALFLRSLSRAESMDVGYSARQGFMASLDLLAGGYDERRGVAFYQQALSRIAALPSVTHASVATALPLDLGSGSDMNVDVEGYVPRKDEPMHVYYNRVGPDYFETLGIDIVEGRGITARDTADQPRVVVINQTMAARYFKGRRAVDGRLRFGRGPVTVVGIARDGKYSQLTEAPRNYMYLPILQDYRPEGVLLVRTAAEPAGMLATVQRELRSLDAGLPLFDVRTMAEHRRVSVFIPKMASTLLGLFGALALILAVVGLYGVVAYSVTQRTREIGVRVALGAERRDVAWLVLRQGLGLAAIGLGVGLLLAFAASRLLAKQLVGISASDPVSFAGTAVLLLAVAAVASALPARRAASLDPLAALRRE
jgi:macrolide transport system ATP-binding/permease protein